MNPGTRIDFWNGARMSKNMWNLFHFCFSLPVFPALLLFYRGIMIEPPIDAPQASETKK